MSSMIHSARPTLSPVANIVFALFCFARFWKVGTDGRHVQKQWSLLAVTAGQQSGSKMSSSQRIVRGSFCSMTRKKERKKKKYFQFFLYVAAAMFRLVASYGAPLGNLCHVEREKTRVKWTFLFHEHCVINRSFCISHFQHAYFIVS